MNVGTVDRPDARRRLQDVLARGAGFERQGFPLGSLQLRNQFEEETRAASRAGEDAVVGRAAALVELAEQRWPAVHRSLEEWEDARGIAETAGMDVGRIDARTGNPRALLLTRPLSVANLEAVARTATIAAATLREALPRYCIAQARALGTWTRDAQARGEPVADSVAAVSRVTEALHELDLRAAARAVADARASVVRAAGRTPPRAVETDEEAIVREAHELARRLPESRPVERGSRAPSGGPDTSAPADESEAAWLSPDAEVEALWEEVERTARARELAAGRPPPGPPPPSIDDPPLPAVAVPTPTAAPSPTEPKPDERTTVLPAPPASSTIPLPTPRGLPPPPSPPPAVAPAVPLPAPSLKPPATAPAAPLPPPSLKPPAAPEPSAPAKASPRVSFASAYVPPESIGPPARHPRHSRSGARRHRSRHHE